MLKERSARLFNGEGDAAFGDNLFSALLGQPRQVRVGRWPNGRLQPVLVARTRVRQPHVNDRRSA